MSQFYFVSQVATTIEYSNITDLEVMMVDGQAFLLASTLYDGTLTSWALSGTGMTLVDTLNGSSAVNKLYGGNGTDELEGNNDNDKLKGGGGADTLTGGRGADTLQGNNGKDQLFGGGGNDQLSGDAKADKLYGGNGSDKLWGGGNDVLHGGKGNDVLTGGYGADKFIFTDGKDQITDFAHWSDTLYLDDQNWKGNLSAAEIVDTYAKVHNSSVVFDFGGSDVLTLKGITNLNAVIDTISNI